MNDTKTSGSEISDGVVADLVLTGLMRDEEGLDGLPSAGSVVSVQEKLNEYKVLVAPVERAIRELQLARGMLRARAEDEINALSPALSALSEALQISTLDLLTAQDRAQFLQDAVVRAQLPIDEVRRRIVAAGVGAGEQLQALGLPADTAQLGRS